MKKNKKFAALLIAFSFLFCGCTANRELDEQSLISTLCFSYENGYTVTVEALTENAEEKDLVSRIYSSSGKTPTKAIESLKTKMPKKAMFDHCAAIVLSPDMSTNEKKQALEYCVLDPTINLGTPVIYCRDQTSLFDCKPETAAIGYDIILILKQLSFEKKSRLYKTAVTLSNIKTFKNQNGMLICLDR